MNKIEIQNRTKELLKKKDNPEIFIKIFQDLITSCVDKEATKNYQRLIPNIKKFYGVPLPTLVIISSEIGKLLANETKKAFFLLKLIWEEGSFEARQVVGKSLRKISPRAPELALNFISSLVPDIEDWSVCDNLAMFGIEPIVYLNPALVLPFSKKWIKSKNKWIRRFGVVSLRGYKKTEITNEVFDILDLVMEDNEKDVKKAVSWILREITKKHSDKITKYLIRWAKTNPGKDTRWIIKDGIKKLSSDYQEKIIKLLD